MLRLGIWDTAAMTASHDRLSFVDRSRSFATAADTAARLTSQLTWLGGGWGGGVGDKPKPFLVLLSESLLRHIQARDRVDGLRQ